MMTWSDTRAEARHALWCERVRGEQGGAQLAHVRHPGVAWMETVRPNRPLDLQVQACAMRYLAELATVFPELHPALQSLQAPAGTQPMTGFGWLPVIWGPKQAQAPGTEPDASFLLGRTLRGPWLEATLVLLAAHQLHGKAVGNGVGLRVTAHVTRDTVKGRWSLRFASVACSRLEHAARALPDVLGQACGPAPLNDTRRALANALRVSHVAIQGMREGEGKGKGEGKGDDVVLDGFAVRYQAEQTATPSAGIRAGARRSRAQVWAFSVRYDAKSHAVQVQRLDRLTAGLGELRIFERDPASMGPPGALDQRRPDGLDQRLDALRELRVGVPRTVQGLAAVPLRDPLNRFEVTHDSRSIRPDPGSAATVPHSQTAALPTLPKGPADPLQVLPLRSDNLAAAQAYVRGKELFDRFDAYGLDPESCFRHARLPLLLRPRARLKGADDGRAVNAEVRPYFKGTVPETDLLSNQAMSRFDRNKRPQLQVRFGSADSHLRQGPQALGLATDPRWAWHEFGHVLNYAATGELEFGFAHSAGDALAAIVADPDSGLAVDPGMRGCTFPWVFAPRRHDRPAWQGYCWCGQRSGLRRLSTPSLAHHRHGYFEEQLLSSSLFRLYRSLGGDTGAMPSVDGLTLDESSLTGEPRDDLACRRSASDYCVYLIMKAISLLGSNRVVPSTSVGTFVGALIDADLGTGVWSIEAPWPYRERVLRPVRRRGGRVHKVIRWAFEQQGLYATDDPSEVVEGPAQAPPFDLFIADRRSGPAGGYEPVALRWHDQGEAAWYAQTKAIARDAAGFVKVQVQRIDGQPVDALSMSLWVRADGNAQGPWTRLSCAPAEGGFTADARAHRGAALWALATAASPADRCNLPPDEAPPMDRESLIELVAHDNNIGLAYLA